MPSVLFVCTANMCRSPMAMAIFKSKVDNLEGEWDVASAGTWAVEGERVTPKAQQLMMEQGLDLSNHRSRLVEEEMLRSYNLILTMEKGHKEAIRVEFPEVRDKVYLLSEMVGETHDVRDPIGGSIDDFRETVAELDRILTEGYEQISKLAGGIEKK